MSASTAMAMPERCLIVATVSIAFCGSISATTTLAPSSPKRMAVASPIPDPAPVMIATFSFSLMLGSLARSTEVADNRQAELRPNTVAAVPHQAFYRSFLLQAETIDMRVVVDRINAALSHRQTAEVDPAFHSGATLIEQLPCLGVQGI